MQQLARSLSAVSTSGLLGLPTEYTQCLTAKDMEALGLQGAQRSSTDSAATAAGQTSPAKPASQLQPAVVQSSSQTQAPKPRMSTTGGPASAARPAIPVTTTTTSSLAPGKPTAPAQPQPTASKPQPHSVTDDDFLDDLLGERASATRPTHTNTAALVKPQIPAAKPVSAGKAQTLESQRCEDWLLRMHACKQGLALGAGRLLPQSALYRNHMKSRSCTLMRCYKNDVTRHVLAKHITNSKSQKSLPFPLTVCLPYET